MPNDQKPNQIQPENDNERGVDPKQRHVARRYALQAMYQWQLAHTPIPEIESEFLQFQIDKSLDLDYFKALIHGIPEQQHDIDQHIRAHIKRSLEEIDAIELAVLRLAIYELLNRPDVPYRVIINEALQLTKKFGSVEGYKFVNGVLDKIAKKIRVIEINSSQKS